MPVEDPELVYVVSWQYHLHGRLSMPISYAVRMRESQAKRLEAALQRSVEIGLVVEAHVEEVGDPVPFGDFIKLLRDEHPGLVRIKDWIPGGGR